MSATPLRARASEPTRRDFLKILTTSLLTASGILGVGGVLRFLDFEAGVPKKTEFDLGLSTNYVLGSRTPLPDVPALLIHRPSGFVAISLVCTHLGCTVEEKTDGFSCPCHGSRYDSEGKLLRGPATQSLRMLRIETTDQGHLVLHTD